MTLCAEMESHARELYSYLPVLCGLGLATMLGTITDEQLKTYQGLLRVDGDPRDGQFFLNFDNLFSELEGAIDRYGLETPLLFQAFPPDRTALTMYNGREVILLYNSLLLAGQNFLVAMSSSRSHGVTQSSCVFVCCKACLLF